MPAFNLMVTARSALMMSIIRLYVVGWKPKTQYHGTFKQTPGLYTISHPIKKNGPYTVSIIHQNIFSESVL